MPTLRGPVTVFCCLAMIAIPGKAGANDPAPTFGSAALPSRSPQAEKLAPHAARVADGLMRSLDGRASSRPAPASTLVADTLATLARGRALFAAGALDEAAAVLDDALAVTARMPHRFAASKAVVNAHVIRATIALARGEDARAAAIFERLLRWDPTFTLTAHERSPRLLQALSAARDRLGQRPPLRPADVGAACRLADTVVVARPADTPKLELFLFDRCQAERSVVIDPDATDNAIVAFGGQPPAPARNEQPLWRRPWVWGAAGAVLVGSAALILWKLQPAGQADVVPHF